MYSRIKWNNNDLEYSINILEYFGIFHNIPKYSRIFPLESCSRAGASEGSEETKHWRGKRLFTSDCSQTIACPSNALLAQNLPTPLFSSGTVTPQCTL